MPNKINRLFSFLLILTAISLFGCSSTQSTNVWQQTTALHPTLQTPNQPASYYLQQAAQSQPPKQQQYQLIALRRLVADRQLATAQNVLNNISDNGINYNDWVQKQLLQAKLYLLSNKPLLAQARINHIIDPTTISLPNQILRDELLAENYLMLGDVPASLNQRTQLNALLTNTQAKQQNLLATWKSLQHLPTVKIQSLLKQPVNDNTRGWLTLTYLVKRQSANPQEFSEQLQKWLEQYPKHPANAILPNNISNERMILQQTPTKITLLLPLHGSYSSSGKAVKNGFLAAYYDKKQKANNAPSLNIIDTNQGDIQQLYRQAVSQGTDIIIGPLTKTNVQSIANLGNLPIPTLALNTVTNNAPNNLYQFGLPPQDEAIQAANKAWQSGLRQVIVIAPADDWGQHISHAFIKRWQQFGGTVVGQLNYPINANNLSKPIRDLLGVNQSEKRAYHIKKILREKFRFIPRRRQDVDMIFLIALPKQARIIRPLLKYYYAGDIPIYSISLLYHSMVNSHSSRDLNGIRLCIMPWLIKNTKLLSSDFYALRRQVNQNWPHSFRTHAKLYALGIDAYYLINHLNQLNIFPQLGFNGATGELYLLPNGHIYRQLPWIKI